MIRRDYTKVYTSVIIIFFFQAEDGIRDKLVTGVQTCALPISLAFSTASAQRVHQGFWISLAPGGAGIVHKEGLAYPLYVRLGGTINQRLLVGIEWYGIVLDAEPPSGATNLTAMALLYPSHNGVLFARSGSGIGRGSLSCPEQYEDVAAGLAATLATGIAIRVGRNVSLTPSMVPLCRGGNRALC